MQAVLMKYEEAMMGSFTSCSVVKMRAVDPQSVNSQVIKDSYDRISRSLLPVQYGAA